MLLSTSMKLLFISILLTLVSSICAALSPEQERFSETIEYIKNYYVHEKSDTELSENALRGMLVGLDPHCSYFNASEFKELKISTSGKIDGIGVQIITEDGLIRVISPIDDTPAFKAGVKAGDIIIKLDNVTVQGMSLSDAAEKLRGKKGTSIMLTILRKGETKPLNIKIIRDIINVRSSRGFILSPGFGYIRIASFQEDTPEEVLKHFKKLVQTNAAPLKGLILDLRNNPGGIVDSSVAIADLFLDRPKLTGNKLIVYTESRVPGAQTRDSAHPGDVLNGAPIIVLVNGGSASASEIIAGALQDHQRAIIMGKQTFGKGSVQTILPLTGQHAIKLTMGLYYTPQGRSIQAVGITPDIIVPQIAVPKEQNQELLAAFTVSEAELSGHLKQPKNSSKGKTKSKADHKKMSIPKVHEIISHDYQVYQALLMLKGLSYARK